MIRLRLAAFPAYDPRPGVLKMSAGESAHGEVAVARVLATLPREWVVVHDISWPGRPRANIDHVAIGPAGVFVIDAKNWSGGIEVRDQVLTLNGRSRPETVASAAQAAVALQAFITMPVPCMGVLCFVRDEQMTGWAGDVLACTTANLTAMLTTRPRVLSPEQVQECAEIVRRTDGRRTQPSSPGGQSLPTTKPEAPSHRRRKRKTGRVVATSFPQSHPRMRSRPRGTRGPTRRRRGLVPRSGSRE